MKKKIEQIISKLRENKTFLVEFHEPVGLFVFMEIEEFLEKNTGVKIDLVSKKALKPRIGKRILEEVINV